jgi:hypothetical protein
MIGRLLVSPVGGAPIIRAVAYFFRLPHPSFCEAYGFWFSAFAIAYFYE